MNPVLIILFALHFLNDGVRTTFVSLLPFVSKDLHLSFTQVGILSASQGFMVAALSLPSAFLGIKFGGFRILFFALFFYSFGALGIGLAPNFWMLLIIFYLASSGFGLFHTICNVLIARNSEQKKTVNNLGNSATLGDLGRISLPVVALFLASHFGWRSTFFVIAGFGLVTYALVQWVLPLKKHTAVQSAEKHTGTYKEWLAELPHFLKQKKLLLVTLAGTIDNVAANPIFIFLPFFVLSKGFPVTILGVFTAAYFAGSILGKSLLAWGSNKYGTAKMFMVAEVGMAAATVVFTLFTNFFVLLGLSFLLGLFARGTTPLVSTLFSEVTHEEHYEKAYGIGETVFGISVIIAPILMGTFADKAGIVSVFYVAAVLACCATIPIFFLLKSGPVKKIFPLPEVVQ